MRRFFLVLSIICMLVLSACHLTVSDIEDEGEFKDFSLLEANSIKRRVNEKESRISRAMGAVSVDEYFYIVDAKSGTVKKLDQKGNFKGDFIDSKEPLINPSGMGYENGLFYIIDNGDKSIKVFDSSFMLKKKFPLPQLKSEDPSDGFRSIAVLKGEIYLTSDSVLREDMVIFLLDREEVYHRIGENFFGNIASDGEKIYAINSLNYFEDKDELGAKPGLNAIYLVENRKLKKMEDLPFSYTPVGHFVGKEKFYVYMSAKDRIDSFNKEGIYLETVAKGLEKDKVENLFNHLTLSQDRYLLCSRKEDSEILIIDLKAGG